MPEKSDDSKELQKEILLVLQRITDRLDMITNYEETQPSGVYYLAWVSSLILFVFSLFLCFVPSEGQRLDGSRPVASFETAPVIVLGVFFVMVIMLCQTYRSRKVSPVHQAWEREQNRKLTERVKKGVVDVKGSIPVTQQNISQPF